MFDFKKGNIHPNLPSILSPPPVMTYSALVLTPFKRQNCKNYSSLVLYNDVFNAELQIQIQNHSALVLAHDVFEAKLPGTASDFYALVLKCGGNMFVPA